MPRRQLILLAVLIISLLGLSSWMIFHGIQLSRNSFLTGAPTEDILTMLVPKTIDTAKMRAPAIRPTDPTRYGSITSSANVIVFSDFDCPTCAQLNKTLNTVIPAYKDKVRLVWRDLPMTKTHSYAMKAAIFGRCADAQGQFWQAHDALLQVPSFSMVTLTEIANRLRLNSTALTACQNDPKTQTAIEYDIKIAAADGIHAAPFLFVGTKAIEGPITAEQLKAEIDLFLKS